MKVQEVHLSNWTDFSEILKQKQKIDIEPITIFMKHHPDYTAYVKTYMKVSCQKIEQKCVEITEWALSHITETAHCAPFTRGSLLIRFNS